jgi:hypothetical protein
MKKCHSCGAQLPDGARACPQCGTFAPDPGTGPDAFNLPTVSSASGMVNPTVSAAPYTPSQQPPSSYGADIYGTPPPPSYDPYRVQGSAQPYGVSSEYAPPPPQAASPYPSQPVSSPFVGGMQQPPLPPQRSQGKRIALIAGIVILALILVGEGIFLLAPGHSSPGPVTKGTATSAATSTSATQSNQDPYGSLGGTLVTSDPMHDNSKGNKWDEATMNDQQGTGKAVCGFTSGAYHLTRTSKGALTCDPEAANLTLSNVVFEATITIIQGDEAGVEVRVDQTKGTSYIASINTSGSYVIDTENNVPSPQNPYKILRSGQNGAIKTGLNQSNVVALAANGNTISLYINGQFIDSTTDTTYKSGQLGVYGYTTTSNNLDVMISNVRVWKL